MVGVVLVAVRGEKRRGMRADLVVMGSRSSSSAGGSVSGRSCDHDRRRNQSLRFATTLSYNIKVIRLSKKHMISPQMFTLLLDAAFGPP